MGGLAAIKTGRIKVSRLCPTSWLGDRECMQGILGNQKVNVINQVPKSESWSASGNRCNATWLQEILDSTVADVGECSLEHLRERSDEDIKEELLKFKGVGPKTAACVLMFSLGRFEFPVVRFSAWHGLGTVMSSDGYMNNDSHYAESNCCLSSLLAPCKFHYRHSMSSCHYRLLAACR